MDEPMNESHDRRFDAPDHLRGALKAARVPRERTRRRGGRSRSWSDVALWQLPQAAASSQDAALCDPVSLINEFRQHALAAALRELADPVPTAFPMAPAGSASPKIGRPRLAGDWPALYLAYVLSGSPALQPFHHAAASSGLWRVCGFDRRPSYSELHLKFEQLEGRWDAFRTVAMSLIQVAKQRESRVGEIVTVDASGWQSPAALEHACADLEACQRAGGAAARLSSSSAEVALVEHWAEPDRLEDWDEDQSIRTRGRIVPFQRANGAIAKYRLFVLNGHTYRSLDTSSGVRSYDGSKRWWGGYVEPAIDAVTGLALAVQVFPADVQEYDAYPALFEDVVDALGEAPYAVSVDRGFATRPFYEFNTRRGVAVVSQMRKQRNKKEPRDWRTVKSGDVV